jgi:hypothetical protein
LHRTEGALAIAQHDQKTWAFGTRISWRDKIEMLVPVHVCDAEEESVGRIVEREPRAIDEGALSVAKHHAHVGATAIGDQQIDLSILVEVAEAKAALVVFALRGSGETGKRCEAAFTVAQHHLRVFACVIIAFDANVDAAVVVDVRQRHSGRFVG